MDTPQKFCPKCGEWKPATNEFFAYHKLKRDGFNANCKECNRRYKLKNKEKISKWGRSYYERKRDEIKQKVRNWRQVNRERIRPLRREEWRRRKARKRNAPGSHTAEDVQRQYDFQDGKCYYCGICVGNTYHVDHVVPLSRGGSDDPENIVIACVACNCSKGDKLLEEWELSGQWLP